MQQTGMQTRFKKQKTILPPCNFLAQKMRVYAHIRTHAMLFTTFVTFQSPGIVIIRIRMISFTALQ